METIQCASYANTPFWTKLSTGYFRIDGSHSKRPPPGLHLVLTWEGDNSCWEGLTKWIQINEVKSPTSLLSYMCPKFCFFSLFCLDCLGDRRGGLINEATHAPVKKKRRRRKKKSLLLALSWQSSLGFADIMPELCLKDLSERMQRLNHTAFSILPRHSKHLMSNRGCQTLTCASCAIWNKTNLEFQIKNVYHWWDIKKYSWVGALDAINTPPNQKWHNFFFSNKSTF